MGINKIFHKSKSAATWLLITVIEVFKGQSTFKYARIKIWSQFTLVGKRFIDGVNWNSYNNHYLEELKITSKTNTLLISHNNITMVNGNIQYRNTDARPLLIGHQLLYETIVKLNPTRVLEVGCGAGDHLANLSNLIPNLECHGADLLASQLNSLELRHPNHSFELHKADLTEKTCQLPNIELIYTHAVLMHISEKKERFQTALNNIFNAAEKHVVLMENWTQHDFFEAVNLWIAGHPEWKLYFGTSHRATQMRIMVISRENPGFLNPLTRYEDLLLGNEIVFH